jgi:CBS domain containing-hemolysin-like protein
MDILGRFLTGRKKVTEEDIQELMDVGEEEGIINEEENEMIRAIFALRDTVVREIMVPRTDMACVSADATVREVLATIIGCGHSRIPVWDGTLDNIVGLIYAKDLLKYWGMDETAVVLRKVMRPPFFIPETKHLEELLHDFKKKRVHIAIVIDEYGGTSGLVTIEDLLEQIVGDIQDEYDLEEEWLVEEPDGTVVVDARLPIEELEEYFGIDVERDKFDTVGGLIFHLTGRIPHAGEEAKTAAIRLTVLEADERRISKVRVARRAKEPMVPEE